MKTSAFASPIPLLKTNQYLQHSPRLRPTRRPRVFQPIASAQRNEKEEVQPKKAAQIPKDEPTSVKRTREDGAESLFARDFQRIRDSFQNLSSNAEPSPVRSSFLKNILSRIMRVQAVIEDTTESFQFPRFRNPSQALPGSATRRFMRLFSAFRPGSDDKEWKVLGYFQWQKIDNVNNVSGALPPSEARRLQRKQRRNMLDGIAEMGPKAWRIALSTGGKAIDSMIQSSIDGTRRHNQAGARLRERKKARKLRKKEMESGRPRKTIARESVKRNRRSRPKSKIAAHPSEIKPLNTAQPSEQLKMGPLSDGLTETTGKDPIIKKAAPAIEPETHDARKNKKKKVDNNRLNENAVKFAQSLINPVPRKRDRSRRQSLSTVNEKKTVNRAENIRNATKTGNVSNKPTKNSNNRADSVVAEAVNFAESLINPSSTKKKKAARELSASGASELIIEANGDKKGIFGKWTLDSYETRMFFVVMGALAAKSLLITITPIVTLVSHAYIISEAQAPRKMPRDILNNYIRRKSRAVLGIDQFVRDYQYQYQQRYHYYDNNKESQRLLPMKATQNSITAFNEEAIAVETVARQVGESTPAILNAPVVGEVLQGVDSVAYSVEKSWNRMSKIVGLRNTIGWENEEWVLLESLEWQRNEQQHRRP